MMQSAVESRGIALGQYHLAQIHLEKGELIKIGPTFSDAETLGWIEFDPERITVSERNLIYNWFKSELGSDDCS